MFPTENTGEKDRGGNYPSKDNHTKDLKRKFVIIDCWKKLARNKGVRNLPSFHHYILELSKVYVAEI